MERRTFKITGETFSLMATESLDEDIIVLTNLDGFDEAANLEVDTVPKLFGSGSYVRSKRLAERSVTAGFFVGFEADEVDGVRRGVLEPIKAAAESFETVTIARTWVKEDGTVIRKESLSGLMTAVDNIEQYADESMAFEISMLCTDPNKEIVLEGDN